MIRRPPRSTLDRSSAASDVYKRQKERVISFEGVENGIQVNLFFEYSSSSWLLVKLEDFSD